MSHVVLETDRLILRGFSGSDLNDFNEYGSMPYVALRTGFEPHKDLEDSKPILERFIAKPHLWAIELKDNNKVIGSIELVEREGVRAEVKDREREIGYTMNERFHGNGYMTEACKAVIDFGFNSLKLFLIRICCSEFNAQSKRVIEKCGFRYDGLSRYNHIWKYDNKLHSMLNYSLTIDEFTRDNK